MDNIVYFAPDTADAIGRSLAKNNGRSMRIMTGTDSKGPFMKFKMGEGMWSPPIYGDTDPYR